MSSSSKEIPGVLTENVSIKRGSQPPDSLIPDSLIPDSFAALSSAHAPEGDFHKIFDAGCAVNPALMTKSTAVIHQWIADGVTAQDAVPEVRRLAGKARSWSFFTGAVMDAKSTRETPLPKGKPHANASQNPASIARGNKSERAKAALLESATELGYAHKSS